MMHMSKDMQNASANARVGYQTCLGSAMTHCLKAGGKLVEPKHFRLMMACAETCRTAAHFMLLNSPHHAHVCEECAECARDCQSLSDMDDCVTACNRCADSCRAMAN